LALAMLVAVPELAALAADAASRPNIVLIMADDHGYECIGANGGTSYRTPVLDRLAAAGVRFEHCYVQPLCTPTRVQLMTGIYNVRNYTEFGQMDPQATTFANLLRQAGYATCITGKWQLGRDPELPKKFGFDEHCLWQHLRRPSRYKNPGLEINGKQVDYTGGEYGPDVVNDYAIDFVTRKKDGPFFLYYPMMLTHGPFDPTPDSADYAAAGAEGQNGRLNSPEGTAKGKGKGKRKNRGAAGDVNGHFGDMVEYMDKLIGRLVARLDELGVRDNTLILFVGDNGTGQGVRSMMGDRVVIGGKGQMTHRGMHVPLIASWPGKIATGKVCSDLVDSTDFLPTVCEAAGVTPPSELAIDGRSFLPQLRGEAGRPREWYYSWYAPRNNRLVGEFAANHKYKLYRTGNFFDLASDPEELSPLTVDSLKGEAAAAAKSLQAALDQYRDARKQGPGVGAQGSGS
jgi:arylsulfatase A